MPHFVMKAAEWKMVEQSPFDRGKSLVLKENNQCLRFLTESEIIVLMRGGSLKDVQELLNHKTMTMTLKYAHLS